MSPFTTSTRNGGDVLYFAYGSNLCIAQMAKRCPESIFQGKATLSEYRWQINERGVANVVESLTSTVEGLLFLVNSKDQRMLDRCEGVSKGLYQKQILYVTLEPHKKYANTKSTRLAKLISQENILKYRALRTTRRSLTSKQVQALVYVSERFNKDGRIRDEYISRMQKAASDGVALGVPRSFVNTYIIPHLGDNAAKAVFPRENEVGLSGTRNTETTVLACVVNRRDNSSSSNSSSNIPEDEEDVIEMVRESMDCLKKKINELKKKII